MTNLDTQETVARELAGIMTAEEVKQRISEIARSGQSEANKLKGLELMARVHALLTDRNINENTDKTAQDELIRVKAAELALSMLKSSEDAITGLNQGETSIEPVKGQSTDTGEPRAKQG